MGKDCDMFQVLYTSDGSIRQILNMNKKTVPLEVEYERGSKNVSSVKVNDKTFNLAYTDGVLTSPDGVRKLDSYRIRLLASVSSENETDNFSYEAQERRTRQVIMNNFRESKTPPVPVNKMSMSKNGTEAGWIEWCAMSGMIMADNGGDYKIGNREFDQFYTERGSKKEILGKNERQLPAKTTISYLQEGNFQPRMWSYDWNNAQEFWQDEKSGEIKRYSFIASSGPTRLKLRKVEKFTGGNLANEQDNDAWDMISTWNYDSNGNLLRIFYGNGDRKISSSFPMDIVKNEDLAKYEKFAFLKPSNFFYLAPWNSENHFSIVWNVNGPKDIKPKSIIQGSDHMLQDIKKLSEIFCGKSIEFIDGIDRIQSTIPSLHSEMGRLIAQKMIEILEQKVIDSVKKIGDKVNN